MSIFLLLFCFSVRKIKFIFLQIFFAYMCVSFQGAAAENINKKITVSIAINKVTYQKYPQYLITNLCRKLPNFNVEQIDRALFELYLMCEAFAQQNTEVIFKFEPSPSYVRSLMMVMNGIVDAVSSSTWSSDIDNNNLYSTIEVIRNGEYEKGIYTYEKHPMQSMSVSAKDIANYEGITATTWHHDWQVINALTTKAKKIEYWPAMFKMLAFGRADFTLMEFPSVSDLSIAYEGIVLRPVKGIKVSMPDSRRFIVSKNTPHGKEIFQLLNNGLKELRSQGQITKIYQQAGFINQLTKDWRTITTNIQQPTPSVLKPSKNH